MRVLPLAVLSLLLALPCLAQTSSLAAGDLSRGLTLPPTGAALADEATAPEVNPAGLTFVGDGQLFYSHERNVGQSLIGDGLYLGDTLFDTLGVGLTVQWLRGTQIPSYRKTTWSFSLGGEELSFGAGFNSFSATGSDLDGMSSVDLGLLSRPVKFLSFGAVMKNVDAPTHGSVSFERRFDVGLGLRPVGDRYSLGVDYLWGDSAGTSAGRMSYALQAEVLRGIVIGAGVSHGFRSGDDLLLQLSVGVNSSHLGASYAVGGSPAGLDHVLTVRASPEKYRAVSLNDGKVALFDLAELLSGSGGSSLALLGIAAEDPYLKVTKMLEKAARDDRLRGVVLKVDSLPGGLAHMDELREAVLRLRSSGKRVIAVLLNAGDNEYLLASAADKIYVVPQAILAINGFVAGVTYLGTGMDRLGVDWDVARVGPYKNAPDQLTRSDMSDEQREVINAYLDVDVHHVEQVLSQSRQLSPAKLHAAWKEGLQTAKRALELGLVDGVIGPEELQAKLEELIPGARYDAHYAPGDLREARWGDLRRIAIIPVVGDIVGGKSGQDPFGLAQVAGAQSIIRALKAAEEDSQVAAIVLRVDSPGGDGLASDLIYREILEAKKRKPVIASMGDVAASGGYYVAMGADEIWAEPTTITGSIGVFVVKPALQRLGDKLGVHVETLSRGDLADILNAYRPWTEEERQAAQRWVDSFYDDFITQVASSRKLDKRAVDLIARGHVWAGADAKTRGLVDSMGGLLEAIDAARARAGIAASEEIDLEVVSDSRGLFSSLGANVRGNLRAFLGEPEVRPLPEHLAQLARQLGITESLLAEPGLKAVMPFTLTVR